MDPVIEGFLLTQWEEGQALAAASDVLKLEPLRQNIGPPQHYIARYVNCGLVGDGAGVVSRAQHTDFGIYLSEEYLRHADTFEVITVLQPGNIFHSNVRFPFACLGYRFMRPGTPLVEILFRLYALVTYRLWATHDALDSVAAEWLRNHQDRVPLDTPPLKRRHQPLNLHVTIEGGEK